MIGVIKGLNPGFVLDITKSHNRLLKGSVIRDLDFLENAKLSVRRSAGMVTTKIGIRKFAQLKGFRIRSGSFIQLYSTLPVNVPPAHVSPTQRRIVTPIKTLCERKVRKLFICSRSLFLWMLTIVEMIIERLPSEKIHTKKLIEICSEENYQ